MCNHLDGYVPHDPNAVLDFLDALDLSTDTALMDRFYQLQGDPDKSDWSEELFRRCTCPDRPTERDDTLYVQLSDEQAWQWAETRLL